MATYAIGDIQGCYDSFRHLLDRIRFDPATDRLWLCGDIVNRGPKSLKSLRYVVSLGDAVVSVLGNHDLHLLALAEGTIRYTERFDSLYKVLNAPDGAELIAWLRARPLAHYDEQMDTLLVHAGVWPRWSVRKVLARAAEVETVLRGEDYVPLLARMYGNTPRKWSGSLEGYRRLRFIINAFTRMRMLTESMSLNFTHTGPPWRARNNLTPWFEFDNPALGATRVVFGHWSALGLLVLPKLLSLDTGCVWGRQLTAARLDEPDVRIFQVQGHEEPLS
ncbi:MAG TPA: symmetrical bis(5'-nucleosyl)-tetraphosphatase [Woeseiaceae bacterium]|nr:symmetrical bis(5'-nucleosyl)-tetraphosphatase [Woeseiaceae bacterium]